MISKFGSYQLSQRQVREKNSRSDKLYGVVDNMNDVGMEDQQITMNSQPQLQSQQLFFQASLQFIRKKKIANYLLFSDDFIGQGSFAKVYKGINILTNQPVAIKVLPIKYIHQNKMYQQLVSSEMDIIKQLNHPNVLKCYDILITDNNCYIVTQYCEDGDLKKYVDKQLFGLVMKGNGNTNIINTNNNPNPTHPASTTLIKLSTIQHLIYDIYQGLLYLERKCIVHRDIKMTNILVKDGKAKIADFGLAVNAWYRYLLLQQCSEWFVDAKVGSPLYMSPQALLKSLYGPVTDVWAFGILVYEFFHNFTPFQHCQNTHQLQTQISHPINYQIISNSLPQDTRKLITTCLTHDYHQRPSFKQLWSDEYIKTLRLKSYVCRNKQLISYKQTMIESSLKRVVEMKETSLSKPKQQSDNNKLSSLQQQQSKHNLNLNLNRIDDNYIQGYSFDDFLRINSEHNNFNHQLSQVNNQMEEFYRQAQNMMNKQQYEEVCNKLDEVHSSQNLSSQIDIHDQNYQDQITQIKTQSIQKFYTSSVQNKNDSTHKQNLNKFNHFLQKNQSYKNTLANTKEKYSQKFSKSSRDSSNIDLILVLLEFIRFIVRYIKLNENLYEFFTHKKATQLHIFQQQIQCLELDRPYGYFCEPLYNFCQQILIKKVSEIVFTLNTQNNCQLIQIVKTHKNLLNGLKGLYRSQKVSMKVEIEMMFNKIQVKTKKIEDMLTCFTENEKNGLQSSQESMVIWRLCWIGLWWARTSYTFLELKDYLTSRIHTFKQKNFRDIIKILEQFVESYQKFANNFQFLNSNQQFSSERSKIPIKDEINYFFQLTYEIQLKKMNLDNEQ